MPSSARKKKGDRRHRGATSDAAAPDGVGEEDQAGHRQRGSRRPAFIFNDTATTEIYTLSLHDALPIYIAAIAGFKQHVSSGVVLQVNQAARLDIDRKSTRLNSSHGYISYAVFCLK